MTSPDPVFLVGAPRSGTTWLQQMIGAHPEIATPQETDLFNGYLAPWIHAWQRQLPADAEEWSRRRHKGLPAVLTEDAFESLLRDVVAAVHAHVLRLKPGARIVLEKVPGYTLHAPLIVRLLPGARFIHVLRDGRDSAASLVRASRGWGASWAAGTVGVAAAEWRDYVHAGRAIASLTPHYVEVRYERVLEDAAAELARVFAFCGVEASATECAAFAERFRPGRDASSLVWGGEVAARLGGRAPAEPDGFAGGGGPGAWRRDFDRRDRLAFEVAAGGLLRELGYERDGAWVEAPALARVSFRARRAAAVGIARARGRTAALIGGR